MKFNFNFNKNGKLVIKSLGSFFEKHKEWFLNTRNFVVLVGGYGLLINFMLTTIFNFPFTKTSFLGYGIIYYFIKEEFTEWFRRLFPERRAK